MLLKPTLWNVQPALTDPKWAWAWQNAVLLMPFLSPPADGVAQQMDLSRSARAATLDNSSGHFSTGVAPEGLAFRGTVGGTSNDRLDLGLVAAEDPLALAVNDEMTFITRIYIDSGVSGSFPRVIDKSDGVFSINGWSVFYDPSAQEMWLQMNSNAWRWDFTALEDQWLSVAMRVTDGTTAELWVDGVNLGAPTATEATPQFPAPAADTNAAIGNWNHATGRGWEGEIACVYVFDRAMPDTLLRDISLDPYGMFRPTRRIATGIATLVVQDSQHGHTSATVALVQQHVLVPNGSQHGHTSATVALVQQHTLTVDGSQHGHTSQNVALVVTGWVLEADDSQHGHTSQQVVLVLPGGVTVVLTRVGLTIGIGIGR